VVYRSGANRDDPRWRWTSVGGFVATGLWLLTSGALAIYASTVASLDATYGSFGGVLVLMLWLLLSALSILFGAYLNAELEHQTEQDTTVGPERPMGERGARMADAATPAQAYSEEARRSERAQPAVEGRS
jgi:membrane protein